MEISLKPLGKDEIHKLETVLLLGTLFREDVLEKIRESSERLTWVDSLAVAAAALARSKAGKTIPQIADELGRSEQTIRNHLTQKTEAGKLVYETYERLARGEEVLQFLEKKEVEEKIRKVKEKLQEALELLS